MKQSEVEEVIKMRLFLSRSSRAENNGYHRDPHRGCWAIYTDWPRRLPELLPFSSGHHLTPSYVGGSQDSQKGEGTRSDRVSEERCGHSLQDAFQTGAGQNREGLCGHLLQTGKG